MIVPTTPAALADAITVLRVIADPATAKAHLDALVEAVAGHDAKLAELVGREQAITAQQKANEVEAAKVEADRKALDTAIRMHAINQKSVADAKAALATQKVEHAERVKTVDAQTKDLDQRSVQQNARDADLGKQADELKANTEAAEKALLAREEAVRTSEAELKAKVAEWQRVTKALQG